MLIRKREGQMPDVAALSERNADGAAPDLIGLRVQTVMQEEDLIVGKAGPRQFTDDPLGMLFTFGRGVFDVRVWVPDKADQGVARAVIPYDGVDLPVYAFRKTTPNASPREDRPGEELDVMAWHQMCRVSDSKNLVMLTRYGFVSRVDEERVVVVRTTRDEAMAVKSSSEVAKRVEGR